MSYYSVLAITPTSEDWIPAYIESVGGIIAKHGGKFLARTASHERIEGDGPNPAVQAILEWPSKDAADAFYSDPEYKPLLDSRLAGATTDWFNVEGKDDFAG